MSEIAIRTALETQLATLAALATAYENAPFTKPGPDTPYQRVDFLWARPWDMDMSSGNRAMGIMQVMLLYPLNAGSAPAATRAELTRAAFAKKTSLVSGGVTTVIGETPEIGQGFRDGDRWNLPVKISFYANRF